MQEMTGTVDWFADAFNAFEEFEKNDTSFFFYNAQLRPSGEVTHQFCTRTHH